MNVLITGGTGFLGTEITKRLTELGHNVSFLSRKLDEEGGMPVFKWNIKNKVIDEKAFIDTDYVIHLTGAGIANERWSMERKREIFDSRVKSSEMLYYLLKNNKHNIKGVISASAVGYYGDSGDKLMTETDIAGYDFLANTCKQWEHAVNKIAELGIRTVNIRSGIVLGEHGGALSKLVKPIKLFVGAPLGTGNQYMSWIHINDIVNIYIKTLEDTSMHGSYNAVAPNPCSNREMVKTIANIIDKPLFLPTIPESVLKLFLGEMASVITSSTNISCQKIQDTGFVFEYDNLEKALRNVLLHD
jgi:uncharacterized protein (TIGR01777 family)